jgi:drug/metabolite transporter (DMT)-like permease
MDLDRPPRRTMADWLLFLIASFIWGTTWLAIKFQLGAVAPEASVVYRFGLASVLLFGWCVVRGIPLRFDGPKHASFAVLGVLLFALNYVLVYLSEQHLTSGVTALVFGLVLVWNLLGARVLLRSPTPAFVVIGAALGMFGVTLVLWPDIAELHGGAVRARGVGLAVVASLVASAGNLWSQRTYQRGAPVIPSTAWAMGYGSVAVAVYCLLRRIPFGFDTSISYVLSLGYLAFFGSALAFIAYLTLIRNIGAGRSGYTAVVIPVVAMATSTLFEGYRWSAPALAGMMLVIAGNLLMLRRARPESVASPRVRVDHHGSPSAHT